MITRNHLPLAGVRVVDFGQQIAGPAVAMAMADQGATVIHIDPPEGPFWNDPANAVLNRNKICIRLDLKQEEGLTQALALIAQADVVIESFRPGVMQRLGIDFTALRQERPELITLSMPGFASNDALRRDWKATEAVVAATSGVFTDMGFNRVLMGLNPSFSPLPLGSSYAISLGAAAVALALYSREKSGRGDAIEVPISSSLMEGLCYNSIVIDEMPERYRTMREQEIAYRKASNLPLDMSYSDLQEFLDPFYRTYECADGRMFYCVCPSHRNHARRCLQVLGIYDELVAEGLPDVKNLYLPVDQWDGETSIGVYPLPKGWADKIAAKMKKAFLLKTSDEWGRIFGEGQIPGAPHKTTEEWVQLEHTNSSGLIVEVNDPEYGLMKQPGPLAWLEGVTDPLLHPQARTLASVDEAFDAFSAVDRSLTSDFAALRMAAPEGTKGWLDGLKVLDLTNVIAGPHSAAFLTRFGAEVIKLDPVTPLYDPLIGTMYTFQCGMGKKSALVDITTAQGREVFNRLVRSVDLVVINAPERQIRQLKLDHETLQAINPGVLFCRLDCLGGPDRGPMSDYIGYDDIIQAVSGIMSRFGGIATPEEHAHIGTLDVNCGFAAGFSIALALYLKHKTGQVTRARTSLSAVTNMAQLPYAYDFNGRAPFNEPSGRNALGNHPLSHFYPTQDGWIFIDASPAELDKLESIEGMKGISLASDRHAFLQASFKAATTNYWVDVLHSADIAAAEPLSMQQLRDKYSRVADGAVGIDKGSYAFSIYPDHPSGHRVTQIDHFAIRPSEAKIRAVTPVERFGHSTRDVLLSVGYSTADIEEMEASGIASMGWCDRLLPN
ncbi:carnitine dehydratase [Pokkaliibacter plantistimulans]|uniref:Carnitine dehydratase n=1 Tax=Pokkaliibacter plantistimulans TaxID=1635171 RepID=A0ABX5M8D8_9GAMM|nr:CoA transferase [Pokkaliibacter plantistimulans]PXF33165.1 carnitine dehydratase [Pokkaliibacter plantistimulans]